MQQQQQQNQLQQLQKKQIQQHQHIVDDAADDDDVDHDIIGKPELYHKEDGTWDVMSHGARASSGSASISTQMASGGSIAMGGSIRNGLPPLALVAVERIEGKNKEKEKEKEKKKKKRQSAKNKQSLVVGGNKTQNRKEGSSSRSPSRMSTIAEVGIMHRVSVHDEDL